MNLDRFLTWMGLHPLHTEYEIIQADDGSGYTVLEVKIDTGDPIQITVNE